MKLNPLTIVLLFMVPRLCFSQVQPAPEQAIRKELAAQSNDPSSTPLTPPKPADSIRIATYNVSLNRPKPGELTSDLAESHPQIAAVAAVIRTIQPDILLLNEVDYSATDDHGAFFNSRYLAAETMDRLGNSPWPLNYVFSDSVNTGEDSGLDVNRDGKIALPDDGFGFGRFPGQYGMVVLSRFVIDVKKLQTLQKTLWSELPQPLVPQDPASKSPYYDAETWSKLRISSKSFWDVPINTPLGSLHVLASHPTPPAFDGPEDRNGCRNHDEIRLIEHYIDGTLQTPSDQGAKAALPPNAMFVVLGDLNSDPADGGSRSQAIQRLLANTRVAQYSAPQSRGAELASQTQGKSNLKHVGKASNDTADFNDRSVGNLRVDYVLPSRDFQVVASGVFWPNLETVSAKYREAVRDAIVASDHHLVWVDVVKVGK